MEQMCDYHRFSFTNDLSQLEHPIFSFAKQNGRGTRLLLFITIAFNKKIKNGYHETSSPDENKL